MASTTKFGATAIISVPIVVPVRPIIIDSRRETRSTNLPISGARKPVSSETLITQPMSAIETPKPLPSAAMIAIKGGANR